MAQNEPKIVAKLLRAMASGTDAKANQSDVILIAAADLLDPPQCASWRYVSSAGLLEIFKLLPPPPLTQDGITQRFEGPKPHDTIYAIREAFMGLLE